MTLSSKSWVSWLVVAFISASVLRAYHPISPPTAWLFRSENFNDAIDAQDWSSTFQWNSPGFTTIVIGGTSLRLFRAVKKTPTSAIFEWAVPSYATSYGRKMAAAIFGVALIVSGLIVAITLALRKLGDWRLALAGGGFLVFSPFHLSQSRVLHLDALVSSLMLLSALLLLIYLDSRQRRYLVLSGLVGGLAVLTKTPSVFLLPFTGLALLVNLGAKVRSDWPTQSEERLRWLAGEAWRHLAGPLLLWLLMVALPFATWPAMWVQPLDVLQRMFGGVAFRLKAGHFRRFFAGQVFENARLPFLFYPAVLLFKSTFVTLPLALVALGHQTLWRKRLKPPLHPTTFWLLAAYVVFFTAQMAIAIDQDVRYILPASLMLDVLAAVGLVSVIDLVTQRRVGRDNRLARALPGVLVGVVVGLQAMIALPYAPDFGAHHNHLLGGNRVAVNVIQIINQQEGLQVVARYLDGKPNTDSLDIGTTEAAFKGLGQVFSGKIRKKFSDKNDYHLLTLKDVQRRSELWTIAQQIYGETPPEFLVIFDGVAYQQLYDARSPTPSQTIVVRRGGGTRFVVLAWVWTVALVFTLAWALRMEPEKR